eukprot:1996618-Pleurochrysis_carterae.AAC.1
MHPGVWAARRVGFPSPFPPEPPIPLRTPFLVNITQFGYLFWTDNSKRYLEPSYHFANERAACMEDVYFRFCRKPRQVSQVPEKDQNPPKPSYLTYSPN